MNRFTSVTEAVARDVQESRDTLNELDGFAGDGDLGVTMNTAAAAALETLSDSKHEDTAALLRALGQEVARRAPSTSGTLMASGLLRAGEAIEGSPVLSDAEAFAAALEAAARGVADRGKAQRGEKTMLDALWPAAKAASDAADGGAALERTIKLAADAAENGARATASMEPKHGRAGWLRERSSGHEDAGARLVAIILHSVAHHLATTAGPAQATTERKERASDAG